MKKTIFFALMSIMLLFVCGCGDKEKANPELLKKGWYPINGGYINLHNVRTITSSITNNMGEDGQLFHSYGPITEENVNACKTSEFGRKAYIAFDNIRVYLPDARGTGEEVDKICAGWLETMKELEETLIEMQK